MRKKKSEPTHNPNKNKRAYINEEIDKALVTYTDTQVNALQKVLSGKDIRNISTKNLIHMIQDTLRTNLEEAEIIADTFQGNARK